VFDAGNDALIPNGVVTADLDVRAPPGPASTPPSAPTAGQAAALENAAVSYDGRTIWSHATFSIQLSEFVGLIGPNGTGKTSLLRVLLGQVPLSAGQASVLGRPPRRGNPAIGYVPQRRSLEADLAVRGYDLVLLGLTGARWGFARTSAAERRTVEDALMAVGAAHYADRPVGLLSGGEQQRLLIAQALLTRPSLLLLDEPLANLDPRSQHEIVNLVDDLRRARGVGVLFVAHDLNPLLRMLDRVVYLLEGRPLIGTLDEVVHPELLGALYRTPMRVVRTDDGQLFVAQAWCS
jgi:zinc/manganese transport system ATP-binding protein